jgi:hypothetical protein
MIGGGLGHRKGPGFQTRTESLFYEDEPTLSPILISLGVALATVSRALEDEVAHRKMRYLEL